jgi:hypothetical protein
VFRNIWIVAEINDKISSNCCTLQMTGTTGFCKTPPATHDGAKYNF